MKVFQQVRRLPEFEKDLKKLLKRFRTLEEDLENFVATQLNLYHKLRIDNGGIFRIQGLPQKEGVEVFKARKLIEIYYKGDQENEDRGRMTRYLESA